MLSLKNLNTYKEKISNKIDEILLSTNTVDINNLFSSSGMVCYEKYVY